MSYRRRSSSPGRDYRDQHGGRGRDRNQEKEREHGHDVNRGVSWESYKMSKIYEGLPAPMVFPSALSIQASRHRGGGPMRNSGGSWDSGRKGGTPYQRQVSGEHRRNQDSLKVAAASLPQTVAGAIAKRMRQGQNSVLDAAGSGATHQALKACAIARTYLDENDIDICVQLESGDEDAANSAMQAMRFCITEAPLAPYRIHSDHPMKVALNLALLSAADFIK
uniref:Uncharacterized protein n=1 Tax=Eutreptiella gymnastica TaxID=73025 RepID=A0A7S4CH14_9EUGL